MKTSQDTPVELFDEQAEEALLGSVIGWPRRAVPLVGGIVSAADFSASKFSDGVKVELGLIFDAIVDLHNSGVAVDEMRILLPELRKMGIAFDMAWLARIGNAMPGPTHAVYFAERVRKLSRLRQLYRVAGDLGKQLTGESDPTDVLGWLEGEASKVRHAVAPNAKPIAAVWESVIEGLQEQIGKAQQGALLSGLPSADNLGLCFAPGELVILGARPGVGKSAFAAQVGMHHARRGRTVQFVSLEMRDVDVGSRMLLSAAGFNHQVIRRGQFDQSTVDELRATKESLGDRPFFVWSPGRVRVGAIHAAAAVLKASRKLELLIVDYLSLIRPDDPSKDRHQQVGDACKSLRDIAGQLQIPVLCLAQLNRGADAGRPALSNLAESADIERDADIVAFLHKPDRAANEVELIVEKNRQGCVGSTRLRWCPEQTRFEDYAEFCS